MEFIGECALCKTMAPLMKSHIIPEFLYRSLYDAKGRTSLLSTIPEHKNQVIQNGVKERLLCSGCENRLSKWERYASLVLNGGTGLDIRRDGNGVFVDGIDYLTFRLFQLSIIWRAGLSRDKFFKHVDLGPHSDILRRMLLDEYVESPNRYGCFMYGLEFSGAALTQLISQPVRIRSCGQKAYKFVFGGFVWIFHVSASEIGRPHSEALLRPEGQLFFLVKSALEMEGLRDTANRLRDMGRSPRPEK